MDRYQFYDEIPEYRARVRVHSGADEMGGYPFTLTQDPMREAAARFISVKDALLGGNIYTNSVPDTHFVNW